VLGLSNGTLLNARLDASMQLVQGQSMFFQVKSNNGEMIAIRPYTVGGNGVNLTLLNALNAAGLPVTDKYLTLANNMMQEQMPIDKNTMNQMARILMANPDMSVNTLVQMKKLDLPITSQMIAQFENYVDDTSAVHKALDSFITELPTTMEGKDMPLAQLKAFDSQLLSIIADGMEGQSAAGTGATGLEQVTNGQLLQNATTQVGTEAVVNLQTPQGTDAVQANVQGTDVNTLAQFALQEGAQVVEQSASKKLTQTVGESVPQDAAQTVGQSVSQEVSQLENQSAMQDFAQVENQIGTKEAAQVDNGAMTQNAVQANDKDVATKDAVLKLVQNLFGENTGIHAEDSPATMLNKLSHVILTGENVSKEALQKLFSSKDMQQFLRNALEGQMYLTPEDVADVDKVKKLYERLESKTQRLENLLNQAGLQETPLAQTVSEVRSNVEFMNQLNQAYTYVQIPLKMAGQNASGQLYVYTNKRDMSDPEKELTAFLHLDLDHLGSTDVSVKTLHKKVDTKFYMDTDEAFELVKAHMPELEERLRLKGFDAKIYVENEGKKVNFLDDFLKKDTPPTGQLHRYSFDVRA